MTKNLKKVHLRLLLRCPPIDLSLVEAALRRMRQLELITIEMLQSKKVVPTSRGLEICLPGQTTSCGVNPIDLEALGAILFWVWGDLALLETI
jgi:hypothetical protein